MYMLGNWFSSSPNHAKPATLGERNPATAPSDCWHPVASDSADSSATCASALHAASPRYVRFGVARYHPLGALA